MGNIVLLDDLTINKIAAGEVIERPASVVKEMVENSIDAGSKHVTIEIKNGGISFIKITDDGKGIAKDDVELAFERHATSKIRTAEDLNEVKSMGFRGEALASIAAIANIELVSKTENDSIGNRIIVEGGKVLHLDEIGCSKGTTITVRNLFFNTPVRYKFLKKDFTESGYIEDVVTRIAVSHPEIAIKFINNGKNVIQTNGSGNIIDVIYSIYGKEIASNIMNVDYDYEYIKIKGIIGKPSIARSNRSNQIFFVNDRYIKDKTLSSAVEQAFKGMLPIGKFAFLVINIELPSSKVDVNVHPAKLEVRFSEENIVFKAMYHAIKDTLLKEGFMSDRERTINAKEASKEAFKIQNIEEKSRQTYSITGENEEKTSNSIIQNPFISNNDDIINKLKSLQENLKREVEQNPQLHLTDKYKEMEEKYNEIISPAIKESNEKLEEKDVVKNDRIEDAVKTNKDIIEDALENQEDNVENIAEKKVDTNLEANTNIEDVVEEKVNNTEKMSNENDDNLKEVQNEIEQHEKIQNEKLQDAKDKILSFEEMYKQLFGKEPYGGRLKVETPEKENTNFYTIDSNMEDSNLSIFEGKEEYNKLSYKFIGIVFNTYIILEIENEMYIMDQHAAHERIMYEKVKKNFFEEKEKTTQMLLLPDIITLTHKEMEVAKENIHLFEKAGFILEEFGENTFKISGVPDVLVDLNTEELFKETLDEINTIARTAKQEKEEKFLSTVACKAAVKAKMVLSKEEVDSLMDKLLELPNPFTCPHGRPTVIKMSKYEIERKFARK